MRVNDASVIANDIPADNGIIHVIDSVLIPSSDDGLHADPAVEEDTATSGYENGVVKIRGSWNDRIVRDGIVADTIDIRIGGGGSVDLTNVKARLIKTRIGGGSSVTLSGFTENHQASVGGGGSLRATHLDTNTTFMEVAGGGHASIKATKLLNVGANAGEDVQYVKSDATIERRINKYATFTEIDGSQIDGSQ